MKITFADMRAAGVRGILVYCCDYRCSHSIALMADRWPDELEAFRYRAALRVQGLR